jgi:hypothetical protein
MVSRDFFDGLARTCQLGRIVPDQLVAQFTRHQVHVVGDFHQGHDLGQAVLADLVRLSLRLESRVMPMTTTTAARAMTVAKAKPRRGPILRLERKLMTLPG